MVLTPQMAISHLVMTIGVGISQKKNIQKFDLVTILWFDPYVKFTIHVNLFPLMDWMVLNQTKSKRKFNKQQEMHLNYKLNLSSLSCSAASFNIGVQ